MGLAICTIGLRDLKVGIAQQWEGEMIVLRKLGIDRHVIIAAADDGDVLALECFTVGLERATLCGSSAGRRSRIKPQDDLAAGVFL